MNNYIINDADFAFLDFTQSEEWIAYKNRLARKEAQMQKIEEDVNSFVSWLNTVNASDFGDGNEEMGAML